MSLPSNETLTKTVFLRSAQEMHLLLLTYQAPHTRKPSPEIQEVDFKAQVLSSTQANATVIGATGAGSLGQVWGAYGELPPR